MFLTTDLLVGPLLGASTQPFGDCMQGRSLRRLGVRGPPSPGLEIPEHKYPRSGPGTDNSRCDLCVPRTLCRTEPESSLPRGTQLGYHSLCSAALSPAPTSLMGLSAAASQTICTRLSPQPASGEPTPAGRQVASSEGPLPPSPDSAPSLGKPLPVLNCLVFKQLDGFGSPAWTLRHWFITH